MSSDIRYTPFKHRINLHPKFVDEPTPHWRQCTHEFIVAKVSALWKMYVRLEIEKDKDSYYTDQELAANFKVRANINTKMNIASVKLSNQQALSFTLWVEQDDSGSRTIMFPGNIKWAGGSIPNLSLSPNAMDMFVFTTWNSGAVWYGAIGGMDFD